VSLRGPGAADQRRHQKAAFINEHQVCVQASGFFLSVANPP
jgi:hypothetical protein